VCDSGKRALADDFGLAEDFPNEVADAAGDGAQRPAKVFAGSEDGAEDGGEAQEEKRGGRCSENQQQDDFEWREVLGLGEGHTGMIPLA
jgi:hypothetical protein